MTERNFKNAAAYQPIHSSRWLSFPFLAVLAALLAVVVGYAAASETLVSKFNLDAPRAAVGLALGAMAAVVLVRWSNIGVLALIAVVYGNLSEVGARYYSLPSLFQGLLAALLLAILIGCFEKGVGYLRLDPLLLLLLAFTVLVFCSSLYAADSGLSDERLTQHLRGLLLFFVLVNLIRSAARLRQAVWTLVFAAGLLAAVTVVQVFTSSYDFNFSGLARIKDAQIVGDVFEPRVAGPLSDPNFYAQILVMVLPLAIYRLWDEKKLLLRLAAGVAAVLILFAVGFTYSRGGAVAASVTIVMAAIHRRVKLRFLALVLAVIMPIAIVLPPEFSSRLDTLTQVLPGRQSTDVEIDTSFQERALLMQTAWEIFSDHPFLGVGAGNYTRYYETYARRAGSNISSYEGFGERRFPHSLYLETAAELGAVGLFVLLLIGGICFYYAATAARLFSRNGDNCSAGIAAALALGLISYGMTSLFLHGDYLIYLWLIFALATAARQIAVRTAGENNVPASSHWS